MTEPTIRIGDDVETGEAVTFPLEDVLTGRGMLFGQSGSGKSNSANVVVEEILEAGDKARSRADRIEQLEATVEDLEAELDEAEAEIEQLEERNAWEEQMAERAFDGLTGDLGIEIGEGSIRAEVLEIKEERDELDQTVDELRANLNAAEAEIEDLEAEVESLRDERDRLEERLEQEGELGQLRDDLRELVLDRYPGVMRLEGDERVDELRARLADKQDRIEDLEQRRPADLDLEADLLSNEHVRKKIDTAAESSQYSASHVWDVVVALSGLADGKAAPTSAIAKQVTVAEKTVNGILNDLARAGISSKSRSGRATEYALDREALRDHIRVRDQREEIQRRREEPAGSG